MSSNPTPVLAIIAIYVTFYIVAAPTFDSAPATNKYSLDTATAPSEPSSGFFDVLASVIHTVWGYCTLIFGALTFNVPDVPGFLQFLVAVLINASLLWSVVSLIRGKGD